MKLMVSLPALLVTGAIVLGVGITVWNAVGPTKSALVSIKIPALSKIATAGKNTFDASCASCHGENGTGSEQGPPLIHDIYNPGHHDDAAFFRAAAQGVPRHHWNFGDMPPLAEVTPGEVAMIVRYIRELQQANGIFWKQHTM